MTVWRPNNLEVVLFLLYVYPDRPYPIISGSFYFSVNSVNTSPIGSYHILGLFNSFQRCTPLPSSDYVQWSRTRVTSSVGTSLTFWVVVLVVVGSDLTTSGSLLSSRRHVTPCPSLPPPVHTVSDPPNSSHKYSLVPQPSPSNSSHHTLRVPS